MLETISHDPQARSPQCLAVCPCGITINLGCTMRGVLVVLCARCPNPIPLFTLSRRQIPCSGVYNTVPFFSPAVEVIWKLLLLLLLFTAAVEVVLLLYEQAPNFAGWRVVGRKQDFGRLKTAAFCVNLEWIVVVGFRCFFIFRSFFVTKYLH